MLVEVREVVFDPNIKTFRLYQTQGKKSNKRVSAVAGSGGIKVLFADSRAYLNLDELDKVSVERLRFVKTLKRVHLASTKMSFEEMVTRVHQAVISAYEEDILRHNHLAQEANSDREFMLSNELKFIKEQG